MQQPNPTQNESPATVPDTILSGDPLPVRESTPPPTANKRGGRNNGKIGRLPKSVRDQLNQLLLDGLPYPEIIQRLGPAGQHLTPNNISQWRKGGHQAWLVEQSFLERTRARQETASDLAQDFDASGVNHAALQLGALHMFEALRDLGPGSLDQKLGGDSAAFVRVLNALARASRETMQLQKYREACARARLALTPLKDANRELTDQERRAIVLHVDNILGLGSDAAEPVGAPVTLPQPQSPADHAAQTI